MGKKQKKSTKFKEISPQNLEKITTALANATLSLLGFNPNYEYRILPSAKMDDLSEVPENILKLQETAIFLEQETAENFLKSKKYIYKIEKRIIKDKVDNGDFVHTQTLFHLIGKGNYGYFPATLIITKYDWEKESFFKSSFATRLKGDKFVVLQRIDTGGQAHLNSFLDSNGKLIEANASKRFIPAGHAHQHRYSDVVMKYHFNHLMSNNTVNTLQAMFYKKAMKLDASKESPIKTCDDLLQTNIKYLNISCIRECEPNESLGDYYNSCEKAEAEQLIELKKVDATLKPHYTRLPFNKIKENIDYIRDKDKPKEEIKVEEKQEETQAPKQHKKRYGFDASQDDDELDKFHFDAEIDEVPTQEETQTPMKHKKRYGFDDSRDEYERWEKGAGRKYEKYREYPINNQQDF